MKFFRHAIWLLLVLGLRVDAATIVQDTFTHTQDQNLDATTGETGATWTKASSSTGGFVTTDANRIRSNSSGYSAYTASGVPPSAEYQITAVVRCVTATGGVNIAARSTPNTFDGYIVEVSPTIVTLYENISGSYTSLGTWAWSPSSSTNYTFLLEVRDSSKKLYVDSILRISDTTHNGITAAGRIAVQSSGAATNSTGFHIDSILAETITASPLAAGTVSATVMSPTSINVACTPATGGTATYSYQFQRAPDSGGSPGSWSNVGSARTGLAAGVAPTDYLDTGLTSVTTYWYRCVITDSVPDSVNATAVSATTSRTPATYYVSAAGSDSNNGTSTSTPWATITKVNTTGLVAGDTVLFRGGDTFSGNLLVDPITQPGATSRIVLGSYGAGKATISAGNSYGVKVKDAGYVTVKDLIVSGAVVSLSGTYPTNRTATTTSTTYGLILVETTTTSTWRRGVVIDNCETTGGLFGITFRNTVASATAAHEDFRVTRCKVQNVGVAGITTRGANVSYNTSILTFAEIYRNGLIADCEVANCYGITAYQWEDVTPMQTAFGFYVNNCTDVLIERCVAHHVGEASYNAAPGGPGGFVISTSHRVIQRRCEAYEVFDPAGADAIGLDIDGGCVDCVIEDCYAHDIDGTGFLVGQIAGWPAMSGSIVRGCVAERCGRRFKAAGFRTFGTGFDGATVYNCTFYHDKTASGPAKLIELTVPCRFYNNVFSVGNAATFGTADTSTFKGNVYDVRSGSTFSLTNGGTDRTSLAAMQAAGYELHNGLPVGVTGDPQFAAGGAGTTRLPTYQIATLSAYDISGASVARGAGVNPAELGLGFRAADLHGNSLIYGADANYTGWDAGAVRYGSTIPTGGTSPQLSYAH